LLYLLSYALGERPCLKIRQAGSRYQRSMIEELAWLIKDGQPRGDIFSSSVGPSSWCRKLETSAREALVFLRNTADLA
jgi:hypothetical protein